MDMVPQPCKFLPLMLQSLLQACDKGCAAAAQVRFLAWTGACGLHHPVGSDLSDRIRSAMFQGLTDAKLAIQYRRMGRV